MSYLTVCKWVNESLQVDEGSLQEIQTITNSQSEIPISIISVIGELDQQFLKNTHTNHLIKIFTELCFNKVRIDKDIDKPVPPNFDSFGETDNSRICLWPEAFYMENGESKETCIVLILFPLYSKKDAKSNEINSLEIFLSLACSEIVEVHYKPGKVPNKKHVVQHRFQRIHEALSKHNEGSYSKNICSSATYLWSSEKPKPDRLQIINEHGQHYKDVIDNIEEIVADSRTLKKTFADKDLFGNDIQDFFTDCLEICTKISQKLLSLSNQQNENSSKEAISESKNTGESSCPVQTTEGSPTDIQLKETLVPENQQNQRNNICTNPSQKALAIPYQQNENTGKEASSNIENIGESSCRLQTTEGLPTDIQPKETLVTENQQTQSNYTGSSVPVNFQIPAGSLVFVVPSSEGQTLLLSSLLAGQTKTFKVEDLRENAEHKVNKYESEKQIIEDDETNRFKLEDSSVDSENPKKLVSGRSGCLQNNPSTESSIPEPLFSENEIDNSTIVLDNLKLDKVSEDMITLIGLVQIKSKEVLKKVMNSWDLKNTKLNQNEIKNQCLQEAYTSLTNKFEPFSVEKREIIKNVSEAMFEESETDLPEILSLLDAFVCRNIKDPNANALRLLVNLGILKKKVLKENNNIKQESLRKLLVAICSNYFSIYTNENKTKDQTLLFIERFKNFYKQEFDRFISSGPYTSTELKKIEDSLMQKCVSELVKILAWYWEKDLAKNQKFIAIHCKKIFSVHFTDFKKKNAELIRTQHKILSKIFTQIKTTYDNAMQQGMSSSSSNKILHKKAITCARQTLKEKIQANMRPREPYEPHKVTLEAGIAASI